MSVLSDVSAKLHQAHTADTQRAKLASYGESVGYIVADMLNVNANELNPFIKKGAQARVTFNELDQVEEERERTLGWHDPSGMAGSAGMAGAVTKPGSGSGDSSSGSSSSLPIIGGIFGGGKGDKPPSKKPGSFSKVFKKLSSRVFGPVAKRFAARGAVAAGVGATGVGAPAAVALGIAGAAWSAYELVDGISAVLKEEGVDTSELTDMLNPLKDSLAGFENYISTTFTDLKSSALDFLSNPFGSSSDASSQPTGPVSPRIPSAKHSSATGQLSGAAVNMATGTSGIDSRIYEPGQEREFDIEGFKALLFKGEAGPDGYDSVVGNKKVILDGVERTPTDMTIGEVKRWQATTKGGTAIGAYQIIDTTMEEATKRAGLSDSAMFSPENQDKLFMDLLNKRGLAEFQSGEITMDKFIANLSKEWAAVQHNGTMKDDKWLAPGTGYYDEFDHTTGKWKNKASITPDSVASLAHSVLSDDQMSALLEPEPSVAPPPASSIESQPEDVVRRAELEKPYNQPVARGDGTLVNPQSSTHSGSGSGSGSSYPTPGMARVPSVFDMLIASDMMRTV